MISDGMVTFFSSSSVRAFVKFGLENEWPVNLIFPNFTKALTDEELKKVTMPSLIIHGTKDRNASYEGGRSWVTALPDARIVTIPGAAHAMWVDDPVTTFAAIRHFLRGEWPLSAYAEIEN